jgi:membrane protein DedA with SNARE-associated domain
MHVLAASLGGGIERFLESISGPWLYLVAGLLTFAETGTLFFLVPGEIGLFVAGAAAGAGDLNVVAMVVIACSAAILGDATGFMLGRRFGPRLQRSRLGSKIGQHNWDRATRLVQQRRGLIVLFGRWVGFLRAIMPATAGMSGMSYRAFLPWDIAGCVSWATLCVVGGYVLGENWTKLAESIGIAGWVIATLAVVALVAYKVRAKRRERAGAALEAAAAALSPEPGGDGTVVAGDPDLTGPPTPPPPERPPAVEQQA